MLADSVSESEREREIENELFSDREYILAS